MPPAEVEDLVSLLRARAAERPDARAYTFVGAVDAHVTYGELDARARAIAAHLQARTAPGDRVLLAYPPGLAYVAAFLGCLYAGRVAVPAYPPVARRWVARVEAIVRDARPALVLTDAETEGLATAGLAAAWRDPGVRPDDVAFLQYTSGSTGTPKGVRVTHANLIHNLGLIHAAFGHGPDSVALVWLPPYHDMGLVGGILAPLWGGFPGVLMPPSAFLRHPMAWLKAIARFGATTSGGPSFAYDLVAKRLKPEALEGVDLSRWRVAFNGAEPVRAEAQAAFAAALAPWGFRASAFTPCYGLAEGTLIATCAAAGPVTATLNGRTRVSSGRVLGGQDLRVVEPGTGEPLPDGAEGEVWLRGPSVAAGYLHGDPDGTFEGRLADGTGPFLRTGDLGVLWAGELFVTGRRKDLLIVDGANVYPQDVEATAEAEPRVRAAAAFAAEGPAGEVVVVAAELARPGDAEAADAIIAALRQRVSTEHGIGLGAVVLLAPGDLPRTSSGKVQRRPCAMLFAQGRLAGAAGWRSPGV